MKTLIKGGQCFVDGRLLNTDVLINDDKIQAIGNELVAENSVDRVIDASGKLVAPGLVDVHVHFRDPGLTYKETVETGSKAAAHGGFTTVGAMPNVDPVPDTPEKIRQMIEHNQKTGVVHIAQYSSVTVNRQGDQPVDFQAMKDAGAFAFSNDGSGIQTAGTMYQAMKGAAKVGLPLAAHVEDNSLLFGGLMTAGKRAEELGVPGAPSVSESAQVARDLVLAKATGVHYHICHVSTKESVELVRLAKREGVNVTCEVTPHHLLLADRDIPANNSYFKMNPPLRHEEDRQAVIKGLLDGTIDMIATDHAPHSKKEKPQDDMRGAANGITGSETAFEMLYTKFVRPGIFSLTQLLNWMGSVPAKQFGLNNAGHLEPGKPADIAIFDLNTKRQITEESYLSKGVNNPFTGQFVYGTTDLTLVDGQVAYSRD
ncbi:MAG: dihydroorotase [Limosilactobacillus sp.]|jgi:dihydroorotase|uniref:dihydroorotase n=1 Tax=Limosilactobacillus sp. TaxID=2773925 RepID=UPI0025C41E2B|nr:dihydroorotase [Limosilactobacillus sp.]MCI1975075.1 dihydroorotase [Limosilactobacillus sp.]MCI2031018.1 dihydroorotase [Limosilactobacillus sp.]